MAGKTKPGSALKGINIKLKMINDLMDVTGSAKDSWNPAEISDDMKAIAYIHRLADTWNPAQLNEALKYLGFDTIDSWNPAIIEETKNKLVKYFLPTEATGNPITFNTYGNLPYEISKAEVTFLPKQSGSGEPSPDNVRPISGWTEVSVTRTGVNVWGGETLADDIVSKVPDATKDTTEKVVAYTASNISNITNLFTKFKPNTRYTAIIRMKGGVPNMMFKYTDGTSTGISVGVTVSTEGKTVQCIAGQWQTGSSSMYYDQSGIFEGVKTEDDFEPYQGETVTESLGSTYYGGKVDFVSGEGSSTMGVADLGALNWTFDSANNRFQSVDLTATAKGNATAVMPNMLCECYPVFKASDTATTTLGITLFTSGQYVYLRVIDANYSTLADFETAVTGKKVCYELATPTTISTSAEEIELLKGKNVIWTDGDDILIEYKALLNS